MVARGRHTNHYFSTIGTGAHADEKNIRAVEASQETEQEQIKFYLEKKQLRTTCRWVLALIPAEQIEDGPCHLCPVPNNRL